MKGLNPKAKARLLLIASVLLSLAGLAAFVLIFGRDFNIYWLILAPVIIVLYQLPAAYLFWRFRKLTRKPPPEDEGS